jgi:hypothetical protein
LFEHLLSNCGRVMAQERLVPLVMWCNKITSDSARGQGGLVATPTGRSEKEVFVFIQHVPECERAFRSKINKYYAVRSAKQTMRQIGNMHVRTRTGNKGKNMLHFEACTKRKQVTF